MLCEKCGKSISDEASFCKHCGHQLGSKPKDSNKIFCKKCKKENPISSNFCKSCGSKLHSELEHKKDAASEEKHEIKKRSKKTKNERVTCAHCNKTFEVEDLTKRDIKEGYTVECGYCREDVEIEGEERNSHSNRVTSYSHAPKKSYAWVWIVIGIVIFLIIVSVFLGGFQGRAGPTCRDYTVEEVGCDDDSDCSCTEKALWGVGWCKECSCTRCFGD